MTKVELLTCGYEGMSIETFMSRLREAGVRIVLDVRAVPISRKRGFSKATFASALRNADIDYTHMPALGCPKHIRERYKADGDWPAYTRAFAHHLATCSEAVAVTVKLARKSTACLVCFEADFERCHRSMVARAAARTGALTVAHLTARGVVLDVPHQVAA